MQNFQLYLGHKSISYHKNIWNEWVLVFIFLAFEESFLWSKTDDFPPYIAIL